MRKFIGMVLLATAIGCTGSATNSTAPATGKAIYDGEYPIKVVATIGMVGDIVRTVGGDRVEVTQLMSAEVDPHGYKATRDDVVKIMDADMVFYCGLTLEGKMADTLITVGRSRPVYAVTERIDQTTLLEADAEGHYDPHVWMDVLAWGECVDVVAAALAEFDPPNAEQYQAAAAAYREELVKLDEYGKQVLGSVPESSRVLITSHDAFNYFGRAYGLEVQGVQGISTESEAGLQRINELVDLIIDRQVKAVFVESTVPRKNIEALVEGAQARDYEVTVGGELFSDAMGKRGTYEGTYIGMLDHNLTTVARALGGTAPAGGRQDKLTHE